MNLIFRSLDGLENVSRDDERLNSASMEDFCSKVVSDSVKIFLVQQNFADGAIEARVVKIGQDVFAEFLGTNLNYCP